jgi:hypothetical protein
MIDPVAELDVIWRHDRMHAVVPIDRDRLFAVLALGCAAIVMVSVTGGLVTGVVLCFLPFVYRDRRRVEITIDQRHVTVERWALGRPTRLRLPLHGLQISNGEADDRLQLASGDAVIVLRWGGSSDALRWLTAQIRHARSFAAPLETPTPPPPELSRLRRAGSGGPVAGEDHFGDEKH